ncbi:MAG: YebC/PmpR family DNA-binding transcriptional regulator [Chloroflexi bacterium]|nr:YebC/PmpR family DNA-binding transcriptional regulator [Chloroflexota bacterium]MBM3183174.1 YebC/PmpR family DNA-binding transcriptional regulator [Chloroflexota bacterium]MBM4452034.1 YebC/PmpR family DNA-binding transcriptional regulator [Chloroflexota bacterium]MBM4453661.1 YebC/PmpR family DNA-binding transcriptional regulator [Chloroflexota bacterium]
MSGHSKWSQIKRQKGASDAKRGQLFTKLAREIMVAVREAGPNPDSNFRLRLVIQKARDNNMPSENIERAIKKGSGTLEGVSLTELMLEGYGPAGVAVMVQALTDNRNRTLQEVRNLFSRHGGNMGESGCVAWIFDNRGVITVDTSDGVDVESLALTAIDAGADDVRVEKGFLEVITTPQNLEPVRKAIEAVKPVISAEVSRVPKTTLVLGEKEALQTLKLLDHLEEMDDVQRVFANIDYSEAVLEKLRTMA